MKSFATRLKKMILNVCLLLLFALAALYLWGMAYAYFSADRMIFPYTPVDYTDPDGVFTLESSRGDRITTLYLEAVAEGPLLLFSHGNGEDLEAILPMLKTFQARGVSIIAYDYPGYGSSSGAPSERSVYAAVDAVYEHATTHLGFPPERVLLYGRSLGSGPSCWIAERYPVGGLILEGAFASTFRVMTHVKLLPWDIFDNLARMPHIECPVLILHGKQDQVIPFSHAEKLWRNIPGERERLWLDQAGHTDVAYVGGERYWDTVLGFIRRAESGR